jgi:hypothetical protein
MGGKLRGMMGIASQVLLAGAIVMMFFVVLSGLTRTVPLKDIYFLRADTSNIESARDVSQWTYFYICGEGNTDCGAPVPALPFGAAWVGGSEGAPEGLVGSHYHGTTSTYYFYLWRFGWVFYLLGLVFAVFGLFMSLLAPCSRLASAFAGTVVMFGLFWFSLAASLMTATFVQARNEFRDAGVDASIGQYAFGFTWGAWAAMFLASVFLFIGFLAGRKDRTTTTRTTKRTGFFRRKQSRRSNRGSFIDTESQRRVKDEYA